MRARVPASSANLGPGFDALALALSCYVEVSVEPSDSLQVTSLGEGSDLPTDSGHLAARIVAQVLGHSRFRVEIRSDIPVGRGLGSSAALAVAAAAAAGSPDGFSLGVALDGHPENAAASAFGGLVVSTMVGERPVWRRLALDPLLRFVAVMPMSELLTSHARSVLPPTVERSDAVFNLGRMGLLIAGLADHTQLIAEAGDDRLHQDSRSALFPEAPRILASLREAGALTSFWSGAGTTLLAVCVAGDEEMVKSAGRAVLETVGLDGEVRGMKADLSGITLLPVPDQYV
jgi:homoserine kinase